MDSPPALQQMNTKTHDHYITNCDQFQHDSLILFPLSPKIYLSNLYTNVFSLSKNLNLRL